MPTDLATTLAQTAERVREFNAALLDGFQREPRSTRRSISRDLARAHPIAPQPPRYGAVAARVSGSLPPKRSPRAISRETLAVAQYLGRPAPAGPTDLRHRMPIRLSHRNREARLAGVEQVMVTGDRMPVSGRARRDAKRQQRAEFWATR